MSRGISKWMRWGIAGTMLAVSFGCSMGGVQLERAEVGEVQTETRTVELGDAESARVEVSMGAGEIEIGGGADSLMSAEFTYNVADWKPEVNYEISGETGELEVRAPENHKLPPSEFRYEWDLRFNNETPLDIVVNLGAGTADLDFADLTLEDLRVNGGTGDVMINLKGNRSLTNLDVTSGVGKTELDLRGDWSEDVDVEVIGGVGDTILHLPSNVGVRVEAQQGLGSIEALGLTRDGNAYINEAYGESDVTVDIRVQAGVGKIRLDVED